MPHHQLWYMVHPEEQNDYTKLTQENKTRHSKIKAQTDNALEVWEKIRSSKMSQKRQDPTCRKYSSTWQKEAAKPHGSAHLFQSLLYVVIVLIPKTKPKTTPTRDQTRQSMARQDDTNQTRTKYF
jgi:hypothetical protein